jgi:hypothetical protein
MYIGIRGNTRLEITQQRRWTKVSFTRTLPLPIFRHGLLIMPDGEVAPMVDLWTLLADNLHDRVSGPMKFRIVLQPIVATLLAIRSGLKDAKSGAPPYFWSLLSTPGHRMEMIKDGWHSVGRLFLLAVALDLVYQAIAQSSIRPRAAIFVAIVLAIVPYLLLRGVITRIARRVMTRAPPVSDGVPPVAATPSQRADDRRP